MKRGMLQLTPQQVLILQQYLRPDELLNQKLAMATQSTEQLVSIELSENELETLLDALPHNEQTLKTHQQLTAFLTGLRNV